MFAKLGAGAAILACVSLTSCDNPSPAPVQTQLQPCNCQTPGAALSAAPIKVAKTARRHRHHAIARQEYSESETYSSHSPSWRPAEAQSESAVESRAVWVDGYGRSHYVAAASQGQGTANDGAEVRSLAAVERSRRDPWHGYDSDCDQKK